MHTWEKKASVPDKSSFQLTTLRPRKAFVQTKSSSSTCWKDRLFNWVKDSYKNHRVGMMFYTCSRWSTSSIPERMKIFHIAFTKQTTHQLQNLKHWLTPKIVVAQTSSSHKLSFHDRRWEMIALHLLSLVNYMGVLITQPIQKYRQCAMVP
jgi:hypothetical protein